MLHSRFYTPVIQGRSFFSLGRKVKGGGEEMVGFWLMENWLTEYSL